MSTYLKGNPKAGTNKFNVEHVTLINNPNGFNICERGWCNGKSIVHVVGSGIDRQYCQSHIPIKVKKIIGDFYYTVGW